MVYVIAKHGKPLMPTARYGTVRRMLKTGRATVVKRCPFTIQLTYESSGYTQPVTLGVDAGSKTIGLSGTTEKAELYAAEVAVRNDMVDLLATRCEFRRARRSRTTRYRKPRFDNRKKGDGWLAPSIRQKIAAHVQVIAAVHRILPVSNIVVEVAAFDMQKIKNPDIAGAEYQEGDQLGFWNVWEYVLFRDGHTCQYCTGKSGDKVLNVHHIESRKTGGDSPNNLITLCETCHHAHHEGTLKLKVTRGGSFRDAAFMGVMRWALYGRLNADYPKVGLTYGYITKHTRIEAGLEKSHRADARCISGNVRATPEEEWFFQKAVRRHNRQIHKTTIRKGGYRKNNQAPKYVFGFQLFDKVRLGNTEGFIFGRRSSGSFDVRKLDGIKLSAGVSYKKLSLLETRKTMLIERRTG